MRRVGVVVRLALMACRLRRRWVCRGNRRRQRVARRPRPCGPSRARRPSFQREGGVRGGASRHHLEITEIPEDSYTTKVDTALAAGSPPDIGLVFEPRWIKAGRVLPLDDAIEAAAMDVSTLNQNALSGCLFEGSVYCLGSYVGSVMLFYNKELFDAAGVPYPSPTEPMSSTSMPHSPPSSPSPTRTWSSGFGRVAEDAVLVAGPVDPLHRGRSNHHRPGQRPADGAHL